MSKTLIAALLVLGLGACQREAYDQPENTADTAPSATTTPDVTAPVTPPTASESSDATTATTGTTTDTTTGAAESGMGMTSTGETDAVLDADLRRCDTMTGTERTTCRADAQNRYDERVRSTGDTP